MHITKSEKSIWKDYIPLDSNYMTFWKRQNYRNKKKDQWLLGVTGEKKINCQRIEKF